MKKNLAWIPQDKNDVLAGEGFHVSYIHRTGANTKAFTEIFNQLGEEVKDGEETALYLEEEKLWLILEGDFRKQYEKAFPKGIEACRAVYNKNIKHRSNWSSD